MERRWSSRISRIVALVMTTISLLSCGDGSGTGASNDRLVLDPNVAKLAGGWAGHCLQDSDDHYQRSMLSFSGSRLEHRRSFSTDRGCEKVDFTVTDIYTVADERVGTEASFTLIAMLMDTWVELESDKAVQEFNQAEKCGISGWRKSTRVGVPGKTCGSTQLPGRGDTGRIEIHYQPARLSARVVSLGYQDYIRH